MKLRFAPAVVMLLGCELAPSSSPLPPGVSTLARPSSAVASSVAARESVRPIASSRSQPEAVLAAVDPAVPEPEPEPEPERSPSLEVTFVGDIIFGRYREDGYDPIPEPNQPVFEEVEALTRSDLLVGNLETPLMHGLPEHSPIGSPFPFGAEASMAEYLVAGGFGAVSLANNHAYDLRGPGIEQTPAILEHYGVVPLGAAARADGPRVETVERDGWRVGFVAITVHSNVDSLAGVPAVPRVEVEDIETTISPLIEQARMSHDVVAVLVHWGDEYADAPSWPQREAAFALVEAGADLVVGHHPHVLQGVERHGHGVIAYSLGNFLFENVKDVPRRTGVLRARFDEVGCLSAVVFHPAFVKSVPVKHPAPAVGYMGGTVKERMRSLSQAMGQGWRDEGDDLHLEGLRCPGAPGPRRDPSAF